MSRRAIFGLMHRNEVALRFYPSIPTHLRLAHSFDHPVGNRKQIGREAEKKFGSLLIDNPFELGRLNDQKVQRLTLSRRDNLLELPIKKLPRQRSAGVGLHH
jgi:hypothetical protein